MVYKQLQIKKMAFYLKWEPILSYLKKSEESANLISMYLSFFFLLLVVLLYLPL